MGKKGAIVTSLLFLMILVIGLIATYLVPYFVK